MSNSNSFTPNFSGIRFNCPVSFPSVEMGEINIGNSNIITGYVTGANIGSINSIFSNKNDGIYVLTNLTGITGLGIGQTPFTGVTGQALVLIGTRQPDINFNLGYENSIQDSADGYNFGGGNSIVSGSNIFQIGLNSSTLESNNSTLIGKNNYIHNGDKISILGNNNDAFASNTLNLIGNDNSVKKYNGNILGHDNTFLAGILSPVNIVGDNNIAKESSHIDIFGDQNVISGTNQIFIIGDNNISQPKTGIILLTGITGLGLGQTPFTGVTGYLVVNNLNEDILMFGKNHSAQASINQILIGQSISTSNSLNNIIVGSNISTTSSNNISFGRSNIIDGSESTIHGSFNITDPSSIKNLIFGDSNLLSGSTSNTVLGTSNIVNTELFNSLYVKTVGVTGITGLGLGQTPFTGITGYIIVNQFPTINLFGSKDSFFVGNNNKGASLNKSYILGDDNRAFNANEVYAFGINNLADGSSRSYILGENNRLSGIKNYIIGNNNITRSGDFNSILIGIAHEFTGSNKLSSITLASFDSKIEVNPSEIKINCTNGATINDQEILTPSNLSPYLANAKLLSGNRVFDRTRIQDLEYDKIPPAIHLDSFSYSGQEPRVYTTFQDRKNGYKPHYDVLYFRRLPMSYYQGLNSLFIDYYYESLDHKYNIIYTKGVPYLGNAAVWAIEGPDKNIAYINIGPNNWDSGNFPTNYWSPTGSDYSYIDAHMETNPAYVDTILISSPDTGARYNGVYTRSSLGDESFIQVEPANGSTITRDMATAKDWTLNYLLPVDQFGNEDYTFLNGAFRTLGLESITYKRGSLLHWKVGPDHQEPVGPAPSGRVLSFGFNSSSNFTGVFKSETISASSNQPLNQYFINLGESAFVSSQGISVIYGAHMISGLTQPSWLIIDNYSSGIYYINNKYPMTSIPQTGWQSTGYLYWTGGVFDEYSQSSVGPNLIQSGLKLEFGTRTGLFDYNHPEHGKIYIPFYY